MTTACNFIAENSTRQNAWNTFQNNAISCISHLETQSIISSDWILQAEKIMIFPWISETTEILFI